MMTRYAKKKKHNRKVKSVSVQKAETGHIGRVEYEPEEHGKDGYPKYEPDEQHALASSKDVHAFMNKHLGLMDDDEKAEGRRFGNTV